MLWSDGVAKVGYSRRLYDAVQEAIRRHEVKQDEVARMRAAKRRRTGHAVSKGKLQRRGSTRASIK